MRNLSAIGSSRLDILDCLKKKGRDETISACFVDQNGHSVLSEVSESDVESGEWAVWGMSFYAELFALFFGGRGDARSGVWKLAGNSAFMSVSSMGWLRGRSCAAKEEFNQLNFYK